MDYVFIFPSLDSNELATVKLVSQSETNRSVSKKITITTKSTSRAARKNNEQENTMHDLIS